MFGVWEMELELPRFCGHEPTLIGKCPHAENENRVPCGIQGSDDRPSPGAACSAGRSIEELACEFEPCAATISGWIEQAPRAALIATVEAAPMSSAAMSARNCVVFAAISWQRLRPGLQRAMRRREGPRIHDREPGGASRADFSIETMARTTGVSRSGFYA